MLHRLMRRVCRVAVVAAVAGLVFASASYADRTETVYSSSTMATPTLLQALAKVYADAAAEVEPKCASANDISGALGRVRVNNQILGRMLTVTKVWLKYGKYVRGQDSPCDVAKELSWAAKGLYARVGHVPPACQPKSLVDLNCYRITLSTRVEKRIRDFSLNYCVWTLYTVQTFPGVDGRIRYSPQGDRCL